MCFRGYPLGWPKISKMANTHGTRQIHILSEIEMLKNARILEIGPRLDMPICVQSVTT